MPIEIIKASNFSIQQLVDLYNQTRVDYLVPMPMSADRMADYVRDFDVNLELSYVAREADGSILGLSMMGTRQDRAWITRLGVLPSTRRHGVGRALMEGMLENASALGMAEIDLEVIANNAPAHTLFSAMGFQETGRYMVMRRAPRVIAESAECLPEWLDGEKAVELLRTYPNHLTWVNAIESMQNATDVQGLRVELRNGGRGWLVYRHSKSLLSHLVMHTEQGEPADVGSQLLQNLYSQFPQHDTYAENIHESDPHLPVFKAFGYFENFSRLEMCNPIKSINKISLFPEVEQSAGFDSV